MKVATRKYPYLNLGCGGRFHAQWINIDFVATNPNVIRHDLTKGVPFPEGAFRAVYHSHLLEHFTPEQGRRLLEECFRVLRPHGVIRVVVPDLEDAVRAYLDALGRARRLDPGGQADLAWMVIELLDQLVRTVPGGRMRALLEDPTVPNPDFVISRLGGQAVNALGRTGTDSGARLLNLFARVHAERNYGHYAAKGVAAAADVLRRVVLGRRDWEALKAGRFRLRGGEVHQWMYDDHSLTRLLTECGFEDATVQRPDSSFIEGWEGFYLDADPDGSIWLPNSLYMEARKPSAHG